jgi:hypothetical protein
LSKIKSNAGNTKETMAKERRVPLPNNIPSSEIIGLLEVKAKAKPAEARIIAEVRIAIKLLLMVSLMASYFLRFFLF